MNDTIGIDISKDTLDTYWLSKRKHKQFANTKTGLRALICWVRQAEVPLVVFEATGVYHRLLEVSLALHDFPFARVNPRQARRFAEGTGTLAKTDRVDAAMLARMGSLLELHADKPKSEMLHNLKGMTTARQALIKDRTAARARLATATHPLLVKQATLRLRQVERDIAQIDAAIETTISADKTLSEKADILISIPGIAKITAFAMLIEMPELGKLSGKQVASLAGLAPISRQSGKWQGKERIQGGRACLRRAIYLPAVVATRFNPDMKAKYHELIAKGKCKKLAITAVMRKLVVMANALLRDGRKWTEMRA
jgi:transposase